jgi:hypothetical protein
MARLILQGFFTKGVKNRPFRFNRMPRFLKTRDLSFLGLRLVSAFSPASMRVTLSIVVWII